MTLSDTIQSILTDMTNAKAKLDALAINSQSETIETGDEDTPAPTVDSNNIWTLAQDTADTNGIYKGLYTFALNTACSYLYIQSVTGHTTPANTAFPPARYTDCADVVHDLASVNDLDGKQVKAFEILSDTAFSVTLTVSNEWCYIETPRWSDKQGWVFLQGRDVVDRLWTSAPPTGQLSVYECRKDFSSMSCKNITWRGRPSQLKSGNYIRLRVYNSGNLEKEIQHTMNPQTNGTERDYVWDVSDIAVFNRVEIFVNAGPTPNINTDLISITFDGINNNPFNSNNC